MSKPESIKIDDNTIRVKKYLKLLGYRTTTPKHPNCNGSDLFAISDNYVLSVEIKSVDKKSNGNVFRVRGVSKPRKEDDLIAIVFPSGYVLIEPMRDHLKCCNKQGDRFINI